MTRLEANRKIVQKLAAVVEQFPDWRFTQIIENCNIIKDIDSQWYIESEKTLIDMKTFGN